MTSAQTYSNGVQLGAPSPGTSYILATAGSIEGPTTSTVGGIPYFTATDGSAVASSGSTINPDGGIVLGAGADAFPIVPQPSHATALNYYEDQDLTAPMTGPWSPAVITAFNLTRVGDRLAMMALGEVRVVSNGTAAAIQAPSGSIPPNFRPMINRVSAVPVQYGSNYVMGLLIIRTDGSFAIGADLNASSTSTVTPFPTSASGQAVGYRTVAVTYSI